MRRLRKALSDLGYLVPGKRGGLSRPTGKVLRRALREDEAEAEAEADEDEAGNETDGDAEEPTS